MIDQTEAERLRGQGLDVESVGEIIEQGEARPPIERFVPPRLGDYPHSFPEPGIYFQMPEEIYHAIPALSNGGIKKLAASPMLYWAECPWMNPAYEPREEKEHFNVGHAYHTRLLEGVSAFALRFAIALDKADYPNALVTLDDIKAAFPDGVKPRGKSKGEVLEHLRTFDATVETWDEIKAEHEAANAGRCFISARQHREIEIAAAMIEKDPHLCTLLQGGQPEVSLFWYCPKTGVPKKARVDYLKIKAMVDLKTIANQKEQSIENAIRFDIANRRYAIQPSHYFQGAAEVRKLVRERGTAAVHVWPHQPGDDLTLEAQERVLQLDQWAEKWASHQRPDEWVWLFQQKGIAPIARGLFYPRGGTTKMLCDDICSMMSRRFREFCEKHGTDIWVDSKPIYDLADEDLPNWSTEI
jgi:hypothetical protein